MKCSEVLRLADDEEGLFNYLVTLPFFIFCFFVFCFLFLLLANTLVM